jgi:hypothetical protein
MGRQFGMVPIFLSEIKLDDKLQHDAVLRGTRSELALLLLHELAIWPAGSLDQKSLVTSYELLNAFDVGAADVVYHPYWAKAPAAEAPAPNVKVSVWTRPGKAIAVVANLGDAQTATVRLNPAALGFAPATVRDYEAKTNLTLNADAITVPIPRHDYRLLWMEP